MSSIRQASAPGPRPVAPSSRRPTVASRPEVRAGGAPAAPTQATPPQQTPASTQPAPLLQTLVNALTTFLRSIVGWISNLFKQPQPASQPVAPTQPQPTPQPQPGSVGGQLPAAPVNPLDAPWVPFKSVSNGDNTLSAGVGFTQIENQTGVAGRVDAKLGETQIQAIAAHTTSDTLTETVAAARVQNGNLQADALVRDRNGQLSAEGSVAAQVGETSVRGMVKHAEGEGTVGTLSVASPKVQAAVSGIHNDQRTALAGQLAAQVGQDGRLTASGMVEKTAEGTRASATANYQDKTTDLGIRYLQDNDNRYVGGTLDKRFDHSTLGLGADYIAGPQGDGGRFYGRYKTDEVGERAFGYQIRGEMEAGALKLPGQDWNTYASGKIVGEKDNSSFFLGVQHQQGPMFTRPETSVNAGFQIRF